LEKLRNEPILICGKHNGRITKNINRNILRLSKPNSGLSFTYSFWIYIKEWDMTGDEPRYILKMKGPNSQFGVILGSISKKRISKYNDLSVFISTHYNPEEKISVEDVPLQKWLHIAVILENRNLDVFVNGKLYTTKILKGIPILENSNLQVCPANKVNQIGFSGYINSLRYYNKNIAYTDIIALFKKGHKCGSLFTSLSDFKSVLPSVNIKASAKVNLN
tara:strand:- start:57 stop:716 length:660 start_codon:yes stop_codon:yes gene_type:complete